MKVKEELNEKVDELSGKLDELSEKLNEVNEKQNQNTEKNSINNLIENLLGNENTDQPIDSDRVKINNRIGDYEIVIKDFSYQKGAENAYSVVEYNITFAIELALEEIRNHVVNHNQERSRTDRNVWYREHDAVPTDFKTMGRSHNDSMAALDEMIKEGVQGPVDTHNVFAIGINSIAQRMQDIFKLGMDICVQDQSKKYTKKLLLDGITEAYLDVQDSTLNIIYMEELKYRMRREQTEKMDEEELKQRGMPESPREQTEKTDEEELGMPESQEDETMFSLSRIPLLWGKGFGSLYGSRNWLMLNYKKCEVKIPSMQNAIEKITKVVITAMVH